MNKPVSIIVEETENSLINTLNNSGLPAFVLEPMLEKLLGQTRMAKQKQYKADMEEYQKSLENDSKDKRSKNER